MKIILRCKRQWCKIGSITSLTNCFIEIVQTPFLRNYCDNGHNRFRTTQLLQPINVVPPPLPGDKKSPAVSSISMKLQSSKSNISNDTAALDTCKSSRLLVDNGLIKSAYPGNFVYLPLGMRVLDKLINLVENCMRKIGGQKILLPVLTEGHLWKTTGRYEKMKSELLETRDRHDHLLVFR